MANLIAVTGNWTGTAGTNTAFGGASVTTAADEITIPTGVTVTVPASQTLACRSITIATGGTFTMTTSGTNLNIGDATSATANTPLLIAAGSTVNTSGTNSTINFVSTSATQQTITTGGKSLSNININGAGSSYVLGGSLTLTGAFTHTQGTFNTSVTNYAISSTSYVGSNSNTRTLTLNSSTVTLTGASGWTTSITTGLTLSAASSTIILSAPSAAFTHGIASSNAGSFGTVNFTGSGAAALSVFTGTSFTNLTRTGTATKTDSFVLTGDFTVSSTVTLNGNSAINRVLVASATRGTSVTITAATVAASYVDFMDITGAGAGSWNLSAITGNSGDAGGNSGITFTTPATQTATGTASFSWSTHGWTSRVPLPQDNVSIPNAFVAGRTITQDMPRMGKDISFTCTGSPIMSLGVTQELFGNLTLATGMTGAQTQGLTFSGRGSHTITTNGVSISNQIVFNGFGGTYTLQDTFTTTNTLTVTTGTFNSGNQTVTCLTFLSGSSTVRGITLGTSTVNITQTTASTVLSVANIGTLTLSAASSTIVISTVSANARIFAGASSVFGNLTYTVAGSTGQLTISGSNTFNDINFSDASNARTLTLTQGTVTTVLRNFNVFGTSGKQITLNKSAGGTIATIAHPSGGVMSNDYLNIQDIRVWRPYVFFAGANSTDSGNNQNVNFTIPPAAPLIRQCADSANTTSTSHAATFLTPTTAGNLLIYTAVFQGDPGTYTPPTGFSLATANSQGVAVYTKIYYKVADGTETTISASWVSTRANDIAIYEVSGFIGTPTLDVTDGNSSASTLTALSTGSGVTNTAAPAFFIATVGGQGTLGANVFGTPPTNNFQEDYSVTGGRQRIAALPVTNTGSRTTTITWTTARVPVSALASFIGVTGGVVNSGFFMFM